jgi:hypothetical protein
MAAKNRANEHLMGEKCAFRYNNYARNPPINFTFPVTHSGKEHQLEAAYLVREDKKIKYAVYFMSVCNIILPHAPGKAQEMFDFFRRFWSYPTLKPDGSLALLPFKEKADEYLKAVKVSGKTEPRQAFINKVEELRIAIEPQI